jgi:hypothetical protein
MAKNSQPIICHTCRRPLLTNNPPLKTPFGGRCSAIFRGYTYLAQLIGDL